VARPTDIGIIDTMVGLPWPDRSRWRGEMLPMLLDAQSREQFQHAAAYLFGDLPDTAGVDDPAAYLLGEMDAHGVDRALIPVSFEDDDARRLLVDHPTRFAGTFQVDPNRGMEGVRLLRRAVEELGVVAAVAFPCGYVPQVPIDDRRMYPIYAACVDLGLPICLNTGVPGPRVPMEAQRVDRLDEVCWFFPELTVVMRHGGEPWTDLAVKLMLKWPNLYYSTSAFAPKHYPRDIVAYANTRGADKVLYAGYFPSGLSLERIVRELDQVPFDDHVWPKFLRDNAVRVFGLDRPR
jgi:predicted TIM-barrel fold metal-dependent hydrolase